MTPSGRRRSGFTAQGVQLLAGGGSHLLRGGEGCEEAGAAGAERGLCALLPPPVLCTAPHHRQPPSSPSASAAPQPLTSSSRIVLGGWLTPNASPVPRAPKHPGACLGRVGEGALPQSQPLSSLQAPPPRAPLQSYELILHEGTHKVLQRGLGGDLPYRVRYMGIYLTVETHSGVVVSWDRKTSVIIRLRHEYKVGGRQAAEPPGGRGALTPRPGPAVRSGS